MLEKEEIKDGFTMLEKVAADSSLFEKNQLQGRAFSN